MQPYEVQAIIMCDLPEVQKPRDAVDEHCEQQQAGVLEYPFHE